MIKLNNKNITYVALADTNNSVKGVKEIWYADSANSVKLVYRRKDALIEGEDYEKYHWLVGDADAYINTLKYYRPYDDSVQMTFRDNLYPNRESKHNKYNNEEQIWGACETNNLQSVLIRSYIAGGSAPNRFCNNIIDGSTADSAVSWGTYSTQNYINESPEHSLYISSVDANTDKYYFIYNGNTKNNLPTRYTLPELVQQDVRIFYSGIHDNGYFNGSFFNFIHYRNNVEITHLIPCKLLKPVPKWLDANGIRRQVGECGMIDLVSGKFYGNVNSVGTFTVENYYERKEWLQTEIPNGTYMELPLNTSNFQFNRIFESNGNYNYYVSKDKRYNYHSYYKTAQIYDSSNLSAYWSGTNLQIINAIINIKSTSEMSMIGNEEVPQVNYPPSVIRFRNASVPSATKKFLTSIITVDNKERYIPCTLTMDLPASMDANNTTRTKGTSGMWDLVSDRFYGNVANSGTFQAVNLAEGVDYEVHQWLRVEVSADASSGYMSLPLNSSIFEFKRKFDKFGNLPYFSSKNYSYVTGTAKKVAIYDKVNSGNIEISNFTLSTGDVVDVVCDGQELYFNNQQFTMYENPWSSIYFRLNAKGSADFSTSKISINGVDRYIPIKLLRSIPAKYDANGIARQSDECGMYDTVNDVFYGNVASSGTFSVSDDS